MKLFKPLEYIFGGIIFLLSLPFALVTFVIGYIEELYNTIVIGDYCTECGKRIWFEKNICAVGNYGEKGICHEECPN